jgi:hypothetical protein
MMPFSSALALSVKMIHTSPVGIFLGAGSILYLERRLKNGNVLE